MPAYNYRGCVIVRTLATTTVLRGRYGVQSWDEYRRLYDISGPVTKPYGQRPFITTLTEAKEYIANALDMP